MKPSTFNYDFLVSFADTDCGDVVYYSRYLDHGERARTKLFYDLGLSQNFLKNEYSVGFMVKTCHCEYRASGKFEDTITIKTQIIPKKTRLEFEHKFFNQDGLLLLENNVTMVCVDTNSFRPIKIPDIITEKII